MTSLCFLMGFLLLSSDLGPQQLHVGKATERKKKLY